MGRLPKSVNGPIEGKEKMKKSWLFLILALCLVQCNIPYRNARPVQKKFIVDDVCSSPLLLKIGLVADTQIQTKHGRNPKIIYRDPGFDRIVDVSIRTPAQDFLSKDMLEIVLEDIRQTSPDMIFYLGDGANNGCKTEIHDLIAILENVRDGNPESGIPGVPTFIIIGNHDYLGAGNLDSPEKRIKLCDDKDTGIDRPLTKREVIGMFHEFNKKTMELDIIKSDWSFFDSVEDAGDRCAGSSRSDPVPES